MGFELPSKEKMRMSLNKSRWGHWQHKGLPPRPVPPTRDLQRGGTRGAGVLVPHCAAPGCLQHA
jgi:hypothetical protein